VRTMLAEIDMQNPGDSLQPGMYLSVRLSPEPAESVSTDTPQEPAPASGAGPMVRK